jgi:hypothetical protein
MALSTPPENRSPQVRSNVSTASLGRAGRLKRGEPRSRFARAGTRRHACAGYVDRVHTERDQQSQQCRRSEVPSRPNAVSRGVHWTPGKPTCPSAAFRGVACSPCNDCLRRILVYDTAFLSPAATPATSPHRSTFLWRGCEKSCTGSTNGWLERHQTRALPGMSVNVDRDDRKDRRRR